MLAIFVRQYGKTFSAAPSVFMTLKVFLFCPAEVWPEKKIVESLNVKECRKNEESFSEIKVVQGCVVNI